MPIHPSYECHCAIPVPLMHKTEDTGMCSACNNVYDERLYEMRLRQHVPGLEGSSLHEIMQHLSPHYRSITAA